MFRGHGLSVTLGAYAVRRSAVRLAADAAGAYPVVASGPVTQVWRGKAAGIDVVAAAFTMVLMVLFAVGSDEEADFDRPFDGLAVGLLAVAFVVLLARKRFPAVTAFAILGMNFGWHYLGYANEAINIPTVLAYFSVGFSGIRRVQWGVGAVSVAVVLVGVSQAGAAWMDVIDAVGWTVAAILLGEVVRSRGQLLERYAERAERAEAEREVEAERRVAEERLRIARELHDLLAHTVSVMGVQAEVAADELDRRGSNGTSGARAAVGVIRAAARDAMAEIRATVTVLRGAEPPLGTAPAPGLARLEDLIAAARATGLEVGADVPASARPLPPMIELTTYRIVQEALTNVVRHADASCVQVHLRFERSTLLVEVSDDGRGGGVAGAPPGFGLRGMSERVAALGGSFDAGPAPEGGFAVRASLPLDRAGTG